MLTAIVHVSDKGLPVEIEVMDRHAVVASGDPVLGVMTALVLLGFRPLAHLCAADVCTAADTEVAVQWTASGWAEHRCRHPLAEFGRAA